MLVMHSLSHSLIHLFHILYVYHVLCTVPGSGNVMISSTVIPHFMDLMHEQEPE